MRLACEIMEGNEATQIPFLWPIILVSAAVGLSECVLSTSRESSVSIALEVEYKLFAPCFGTFLSLL